MKYTIYTGQPRITCRIDEEGWDKVNLRVPFMCLGGSPETLYSMYDCGRTGHTRSSAARAMPHPFAKEVCPNMH